jgi:hypothetical protein
MWSFMFDFSRALMADMGLLISSSTVCALCYGSTRSIILDKKLGHHGMQQGFCTPTGWLAASCCVAFHNCCA